MKNSNKGMSFVSLIILIIIVSVAIMAASQAILSQLKTQQRVKSKGTINDIRNSIQTVMTQTDYCTDAFYKLDGSPLSFTLTQWNNSINPGSQIFLSEIRINGNAGQSIVKVGQAIDHVTIDKIFITKKTSTVVRSVLPSGDYLYPSTLTIQFGSGGASGDVGFAPISLDVTIISKPSGLVSTCTTVYHKMTSAMATRSAYTLAGIGCYSSVPIDRYTANSCSDIKDNVTGDDGSDGVCDAPSGQLAVNSHPSYNPVTALWDGKNVYRASGRVAATTDSRSFTRTQEGRCWIEYTTAGLAAFPFKYDSDGNSTGVRWRLNEVFIIPNNPSGYLTIGCNTANGWNLAGCIRKSYNPLKSGDADSDIASSGGNQWCYTNNHMAPHSDGAWTSIREDVSAICTRVDN